MASILFHRGAIWTASEASSVTALLVREGVVAAVGATALSALDNVDEVVDLEGGLLMPSFGDGHAHPIFGGAEADGPAVGAARSVADVVHAVRDFAEIHPELEWIVGASYDGSLAPNGLFDAHWLDDAVRDRPVVLRASDYHTVWCNSRALELAEITAATPEPELGEIPRRSDGSPLGTLREWGAIDLVMAIRPAPTLEQRLVALDRAADYFLTRGVTWVQDAWVEAADVEAYVAAVATGRLRLRVNLALYADPRTFEVQHQALVHARRRVEALGSDMLTANTIKFFADGVIENETGALLEPYCTGVHSHGMSVWDPQKLADAVCAVDAAGFQVHIHAIGDLAVRQALDAIEHAVVTNGPRDRRPVIAHAQLVNDDDLSRFAALGVIATMQPLWAQKDPLMTVLTEPRLGPERSATQYRMRTLLDTGTVLAFGSDWPVSSGDPRDGVAVAASRQTTDGHPAGGWTPHEIVPIENALAAYTSGVAYQAYADLSAAPWGRITPGSSADLVWLARDPRGIDPHTIPSVEIRQTYLHGIPQIAPRRNGASPF